MKGKENKQNKEMSLIALNILYISFIYLSDSFSMNAEIVALCEWQVIIIIFLWIRKQKLQILKA